VAFKKGQGGRPKGVTNKFGAELKDMILQALSKAGGVTYLQKQAMESPTAFLTLVGKVLPLQVTGKDDAPLIPPGSSFAFIVQQAPESENRT
jgi:hypothetical protein